jgi:hypothetical protein
MVWIGFNTLFADVDALCAASVAVKAAAAMSDLVIVNIDAAITASEP